MSRRRGFTVIELMVVILIIAILLGLLMPAIHRSREAARRAQCTGHMKQLILALANYESVHWVYPYGVGGSNPPGPGRVPRWSTHTQLLPWIEQSAVFNAINFSGVAWLADPAFGPPNATAIQTNITNFVCPSDDDRPDPYNLGHTSYRGCAGTNPWNLAMDSPDGTGKNDGMFWYQSAVRMAAITDGTTNTAAFSERCLGSPTGMGPAADYYMVDANPASCAGVMASKNPRYGVAHEQSGQRWGDGAIFYTRYNHILPPNQTSCLLDGNTDHASPVVVTASSRHPGGVNLATVDGAVRFIKDSVDPKAWQYMATIAGGEVGCTEPY
jgi:prepilin-type N-terminal cleavage/methylation domain-containing protein/prepilin-type processing-associated H-X9-DG protein